ncbi:MAG: ThiF family adenylyltransferase [Ruminococcus sp.]|nr:ThiF family adenylyltransferase [Ruminococcus sp.]
MKYYLNQYYPVISQPDGTVVFPLIGKTSYSLEKMQELLNGGCIDEEKVIADFGKETFEKWLSDGVLLTEQPDTVSRYSRADSFCFFMNIPDHRKKLKKSKILILGCGGIGSHVAWNMSALGVGHIYLVDGDRVEESNLNRQLLYDMEDIGKMKALTLGQKLKKINPESSYYPICQNIDSKETLAEMIHNISPDVVVKSFDSPIYISSWVDEICEEQYIKYVCGIMNGPFHAIAEGL